MRLVPRKGLFRVDYLRVCKYLRLRPHPALLPAARAAPADERLLLSVSLGVRAGRGGAREAADDAAAAAAAAAGGAAAGGDAAGAAARAGRPAAPPLREAFDMADPRDAALAFRDVAFGWADALALGAALASARHMHTLRLWRAGLSAAALVALGRALPASRITTLAIEDNALGDGDEGALPPGALAPPLDETPPEPTAAEREVRSRGRGRGKGKGKGRAPGASARGALSRGLPGRKNRD